MTRVFVDSDAAGAFLSITRPGAPSEEVRLSESDVVKLMQEAAQAWLRTGRQVKVTPARWPDHSAGAGNMIADDAPPHFIGAMGE